MAQRIWKYVLPLNDETVIEAPRMTRWLTAQMQGVRQPRDLCVWGVVDDQAPTVRYTFHVIGTGHKIPDYLTCDGDEYVGTVQDGSLVWHVFQSGWDE